MKSYRIERHPSMNEETWAIIQEQYVRVAQLELDQARVAATAQKCIGTTLESSDAEVQEAADDLWGSVCRSIESVDRMEELCRKAWVEAQRAIAAIEADEEKEGEL